MLCPQHGPSQRFKDKAAGQLLWDGSSDAILKWLRLFPFFSISDFIYVKDDIMPGGQYPAPPVCVSRNLGKGLLVGGASGQVTLATSPLGRLVFRVPRGTPAGTGPGSSPGGFAPH